MPNSETTSFLLDVVEKLDLKSSLVIVSPSMSGRFSLPFVVEHPERVKGFIPVAPVQTEKFVDKFAKVFVSAFPPSSSSLSLSTCVASFRSVCRVKCIR